MVRGAAALLTAPVLATAYFAIAPALPDLGDGDLPLLVADGLGLIAIAATVWSLLPAWRAQNVLAFVLVGAAVVTGILNLAGVGALANVPEALAASAAGLLLASALATPAVALAVPLFVAAIDIWSVASGPTRGGWPRWHSRRAASRSSSPGQGRARWTRSGLRSGSAPRSSTAPTSSPARASPGACARGCSQRSSAPARRSR